MSAPSPVVSYVDGKDWGRNAHFTCLATAGAPPGLRMLWHALEQACGSGARPALGAILSSGACTSGMTAAKQGMELEFHQLLWAAEDASTSISKLKQKTWSAGDGSLVVGASDGRIRLFDRHTLSRPSAVIPSLGCGVTFVDVDQQGQYILATTDHFMLLLQVLPGCAAALYMHHSMGQVIKKRGYVKVLLGCTACKAAWCGMPNDIAWHTLMVRVQRAAHLSEMLRQRCAD